MYQICRHSVEYKDSFRKILLSKNSLYGGAYKRAVCFVSRLVEPSAFTDLFVRMMRLWADPVIAKAHVAQEVVHYSKLVFVGFVHMDQNEVLIRH